MRNARIIEADHGPRLIIEESETHTREIDLVHIVGMSELLGIADLGETLEAIIADQDSDVEHPVDLWEDAFTLLKHRERAREAEAVTAQQEGAADDPRSPVLRSALAAYRAVHQPVGGGECVMDRCRRTARDTLGLAEPTRKAGAATRATSMTTITGDCAELLKPYAQELERLRSHVLHDIADTGMGDPLAPPPAPEPEPADPVQTIFAKYGGTA